MSDVRLADAFSSLLESDPRIRLLAYDGIVAGRADAPVVLDVRSERAIRYIATAPSDLGLARAFVTGELEVFGDLHAGLTALVSHRVSAGMARGAVDVLRTLGPGALRRPQVPAEEAVAPWRRGVRHSKKRDAYAIAHHYNVSNRFYELILGPSMTYTCAVYGDRVAAGTPTSTPPSP